MDIFENHDKKSNHTLYGLNSDTLRVKGGGVQNQVWAVSVNWDFAEQSRMYGH